MQKDCQTIFAHPKWKDEKLGSLSTAWYQREFTIPESWRGHSITLSLSYLNSFAVVWVDEQKAGEIRFPAGEVDLTALCRPGQKQVLSVMVVAMPLKGVMLSYSDTFGAKQTQGRVERRGLCGDVFLTAIPTRAKITDVKVTTSTRKWEIGVDAGLTFLQCLVSRQQSLLQLCPVLLFPFGGKRTAPYNTGTTMDHKAEPWFLGRL